MKRLSGMAAVCWASRPGHVSFGSLFGIAGAVLSSAFKVGNRFPNLNHDFLKEVFLIVMVERIDPDQPIKDSAVLGEPAIECVLPLGLVHCSGPYSKA